MAKKFYLNDAGAGYNPSVAKGAWDDLTNQPNIGQLGDTPAGVYATLALPETSTSATHDVLLASFVSDALVNPVSFTTSDIVTGVLDLLESNAAMNAVTHLHIWVTTGNSDTVRGTLLNDNIGTIEWPTTEAGVVIGSLPLANNVSALAGDRIVIEIGYQAQNTAATSYTGTMGFGTGGGPDLSEGDTSVSANPSWIQFSSDFGSEIVLLGSSFGTASGTHTVTATPKPNDLIVIVTASTGNTATTAPTDNNTHGGVYDSITSAVKLSSADRMGVYVRQELIQYTTSTVFTHAPGTSSGGGLAVYAVRGIAKVGSAAVRQSAVQSNTASGTPTPTFASSVLTTNGVIAAVFNGTNPGGISARSGFTRDANLGYATPNTGVDVMHIGSGETGTGMAMGSSSASAFCAIAIELDMSITTLQNHTDSFPGVALDATKWYDNTQAGGIQAVSGNTVTLTAPALTAGGLAEIETQQRYTLVGSYAMVKAVVTQVAVADAEAKLVVYQDEYGNQIQMVLSNGDLVASHFVAGALTTIATITHNATTMAWWRVREASGVIYWDYSADGLSWTNLGSVAAPMSVTLIRSSIVVYNGVSSVTGEVGVFSSYNIIPNITSTKTIQGLSRIRKSVTQTIQGLARVRKTVTQTITGRGRIRKTVSQTLQGLSRIRVTTTKTIAGKANLLATTARTIAGKARLKTPVGMKSVLFGGQNNVPSTTAVGYDVITAAYTSSWSTTEANRSAPVPCAMILSRLYVAIDTSPGSGKSYNLTVMKNGSATSLTATISDSDTSAVLTGVNVSFAAGDRISMRCTPSGTPNAIAKVWWSMMVKTTGQFAPIIGSNGTNTDTASTAYANAQGGNNLTWDTTELNMQTIVPTSGTLKNLYITLNGSPGSAKSYDITLVVNGTPSTLTVNVAGSNTTGNDTTHSVAISAGDTISIQAVPTGTPTARIVSWGIEFDPTNEGESFIGYGSAMPGSTTSTQYEGPNGNGSNSFGATESDRNAILGAFVVRKMYIKLGTAPGAGKSRTYTLRRGAASSGLAVTVSDAATTANATFDAAFNPGDKIGIQHVPTGTPAANTGGVHIGLLIYFPPIETVQSTLVSGGSVASQNVTLPYTPLPGNTIVIAITSRGANAGATGVTDNQSVNSYSEPRAAQATPASGDKVQIFTGRAVGSSGSFTLTIAFAGTSVDYSIVAYEIEASSTLTPDVSNSANGTSTTPASGTVTPTDYASYVIAAEVDAAGDGVTITPAAGYIIRRTQLVSSTLERIGTEDQFLDIPASINGNFTIGSSAEWAAMIVVLKQLPILTTTQTILGRARIRKTVTQTLQGVSRIRKTITQTLIGTARIRKSVTQALNGLSRIQRISNARILFLQTASNTSDLTTYTFPAQNLGEVAGDRYIIVSIGGRNSITVTSKTVDTVTVDGISATKVVERQNAQNISAIFIAKVPTGTSGDVVVTFSEGMLRAGISLYRAVNINPTAFATNSSISIAPSVSLDIPANGFAIASSVTAAISNGDATWTNLNKEYDSRIEFLDFSGASKEFSSFQTGLTLTATWTDTPANSIGVFASFAFAGDILGKARITALVVQTIAGNSRIRKSVTQTITGITRIRQSVTQTLTGVSRITNYGGTRKNLCSNPSFETSSGIFWSNSGLRSNDFGLYGSYSAKTTTGFTSGTRTSGNNYLNSNNTPFIPRLGQTYIFSAYVYVPVGSPITQVNMGIRNFNTFSYLSTSSIKSVTPGSWVRVSVQWLCTSVISLRFTIADANAPGFTGSASHYIDGLMIEETDTLGTYFDGSISPATWDGIADESISSLIVNVITGQARIQKAATQTILAVARIRRSVTQTLQGIALIRKIVNQTITAKARITASATQTIVGRGRIRQTALQTIAGISRVRKVVVKTILGNARIQKVLNATIAGRARVQQRVTVVILGKANIFATTTQAIGGKARIEHLHFDEASETQLSVFGLDKLLTISQGETVVNIGTSKPTVI